MCKLWRKNGLTGAQASDRERERGIAQLLSTLDADKYRCGTEHSTQSKPSTRLNVLMSVGLSTINESNMKHYDNMVQRITVFISFFICECRKRVSERGISQNENQVTKKI